MATEPWRERYIYIYIYIYNITNIYIYIYIYVSYVMEIYIYLLVGDIYMLVSYGEIYIYMLVMLCLNITNIYVSIHETVQPLTTPTPYWLWKMYIILAMEPQPTTSEQSTLKKEKCLSGIPTRVHHRLPGLTLLPV